MRLVRLFTMQSDSELLIFIFLSEKRMGLLIKSDFEKSDGIKSDLNTMAQVVRFWPNIRRLDPSDYQSKNRKMASVFNQVKICLSRAGLVQQQYKVHTKVRVAIDALDNEYNHDARTQTPRLTEARLQLAVGRRGLGPRGQGEQRTQRASFVAAYHARVHTEQQLLCWALMLC